MNIPFVNKLPDNPGDLETVWLSLGKPGFWVQMVYVNGQEEWVETAGIACPYIPEKLQ